MASALISGPGGSPKHTVRDRRRISAIRSGPTGSQLRAAIGSGLDRGEPSALDPSEVYGVTRSFAGEGPGVLVREGGPEVGGWLTCLHCSPAVRDVLRDGADYRIRFWKPGFFPTLLPV